MPRPFKNTCIYLYDLSIQTNVNIYQPKDNNMYSLYKTLIIINLYRKKSYYNTYEILKIFIIKLINIIILCTLCTFIQKSILKFNILINLLKKSLSMFLLKTNES